MSAAAQIAAASPQLTAELWTSFASLLRSHVAMVSLAHPDAQLQISSRSKVLEVLGMRGRLTISEPGVSGMSAIEFRPEAASADEYTTFFFTQEGAVRFEDSDDEFEMEAAVEHLLRKVHA